MNLLYRVGDLFFKHYEVYGRALFERERKLLGLLCEIVSYDWTNVLYGNLFSGTGANPETGASRNSRSDRRCRSANSRSALPNVRYSAGITNRRQPALSLRGRVVRVGGGAESSASQGLGDMANANGTAVASPAKVVHWERTERYPAMIGKRADTRYARTMLTGMHGGGSRRTSG